MSDIHPNMTTMLDNYPGATVNSSIGYCSWSGREGKGRQRYKCTQYKPTKVSLLGVSQLIRNSASL